jgi:hypothetical protein
VKALLASLLFLALAGGLLLRSSASETGDFDKLNDADRAAFQQRFVKEVWPLLSAGGKDGCVGCHHAKAGNTLKFSGKSDADFRMLLKEGFFLKDDSGSMLHRIESKKKDRMPPLKLPAWSEQDQQTLRAFVADLDKKQAKK